LIFPAYLSPFPGPPPPSSLQITNYSFVFTCWFFPIIYCASSSKLHVFVSNPVICPTLTSPPHRTCPPLASLDCHIPPPFLSISVDLPFHAVTRRSCYCSRPFLFFGSIFFLSVLDILKVDSSQLPPSSYFPFLFYSPGSRRKILTLISFSRGPRGIRLLPHSQAFLALPSLEHVTASCNPPGEYLLSVLACCGAQLFPHLYENYSILLTLDFLFFFCH